MYDGSVMKIRPPTARRFIAIYLEGDEQLRKKLLGLLKTKSVIQRNFSQTRKY